MKSNLLISGLLVAITVLSSSTPLNKTGYKLHTIVIDAGHGGKDPGCLGKFSKEAHVSLSVALKLGKLLGEYMPDVKVLYTRDENKFIELHDRANIANRNNASLFISLHCNSAENKKVFGTETYCMGLHTSEGNLEVAKRENSVILQESNFDKHYDGFDPNSPLGHIIFANHQSAYLDRSLRVAEKIETQFNRRLGKHSRGVKQAGFLVLWKTAMPSVLVEMGYLTNTEDEKYLNDELGQLYIASAIFRAVRDYRAEVEPRN